MKKKILIIDDYPETVDLLRAVLEGEGYDVTFSYSGIEGLNRARKDQPDLVLLDVLLPKIDGYKICKMLKFDERYKEIPVIILTSRASELDREKGLRVGANDYLFKPFDIPALLEIIKNNLVFQTKGAD